MALAPIVTVNLSIAGHSILSKWTEPSAPPCPSSTMPLSPRQPVLRTLAGNSSRMVTGSCWGAAVIVAVSLFAKRGALTLGGTSTFTLGALEPRFARAASLLLPD